MSAERVFDLQMKLYYTLGELKCLKHSDFVSQRMKLKNRLLALGNEIGETVALPKNQQSFLHYARLGD